MPTEHQTTDERRRLRAVEFAFDTLPLMTSFLSAVLITIWCGICLMAGLLLPMALDGLVGSGIAGAIAATLAIMAYGLAAVIGTEMLFHRLVRLGNAFERRIQDRVMSEIEP